MRFNHPDFVFNHVEHVEHVTLPVSTCSTWLKNSRALRSFAAVFALLCSLSASALPLAWRADWPDCRPVEKLVHRGTDVALQPTFYINGSPAATNGWTFTTYVQTNAVGQWFGPLPGAYFSHTNDVGAAFYSVMVRAQAADGGVNYTAFARFRMLDSPGFSPGELPLPTKYIDFADVTVLNPPWPSGAEGLASLEDLAAVSQDGTNYTDALRSDLDIGEFKPWRSINSDYSDKAWALSSDSDIRTSESIFAQLDAATATNAAQSAALESKASTNDVQLTPVFSQWTCNPPVLDGQMLSVVELADMYELRADDYPISAITKIGGETSLNFSDHDVTAIRTVIGYTLGSQTNKVLASTNDLVKTQALTNYYTIAETDDAIDALAAYYITTSNGQAFATYAALTNTTVYYSGGALRVPTRNDYAVVLSDETHSSNEWRYIYTVSVVGTTTNRQWEAQYPIETNDYEALSNKPQIGGVALVGNKSAADLGLLTSNAISATDSTFSNAVLQVGLGIDTNTVAAINALVADESSPLPSGGATTVGGLLIALAAAVAALKRKKADVTSLPYTLVSPTVTTANGAESCQLVDRAVNSVTLQTASFAPTFPVAPGNNLARDFFVRITATSDVTLTLPQGVSVENAGGDIPAIEGSKTTLLYFSEVATNRFLLKGESVQTYTAS